MITKRKRVLPVEDGPTDEEIDDTLDPPMEPAQVKDMFPGDYKDPDEDE